MRGEKLDEVVNVSPEVCVASQRDARGTRLEKMRRVDHTKSRITARVESHFRQNADTDAKLHVCLDHIGVYRGEHDVGFDAARFEGSAYWRFGVEGEVVGHYRISGDCLERESPFVEQWMSGCRNHRAVPAR